MNDKYFMVFEIVGADVNIAGTVDEETPLALAVKSSSARCVKEIIQMYPKQLHVQVGSLNLFFLKIFSYNSLKSALTRFETIKHDNDTKENNDLFIDLLMKR